MDFDNWLEQIKAKYVVEVKKIPGNSHFNAYEYSFHDPHGQGMSFIVMNDDQNNPSLFTAIPFSFNWFNIAEGIKPEDILKAAECCLSGRLHFKKSLMGSKYRLTFDPPISNVRSEAANVQSDQIDGWLKGYAPVGSS